MERFSTTVSLGFCKTCPHCVQSKMRIGGQYHTPFKKPREIVQYSCEVGKLDGDYARIVGYSNERDDTKTVLYFLEEETRDEFLKKCPYVLENLLDDV